MSNGESTLSVTQAARAVSLMSIADETRATARFSEETVSRISQINRHMNMLGLNARIEAARVGAAGAGFALVADEVRAVSAEINGIAADLGDQLVKRLSALESMVQDLSTAATGTRLVDLAFTAIDLIDRNLYERSCDVRWWATDADLVAAAGTQDDRSLSLASSRLGVILDAYTVYSDIWLCDLRGRILCNGRPGKFPVAGRSVAGADWFVQALKVADGDGFIAGGVEASPLLGGAVSMVWATPVRAGGARRGAPLGVLATQFDWGPQSNAVLASLRFGADAGQMRAMITDGAGTVLAQRAHDPQKPTRMALGQEGEAAAWVREPTLLRGFHRTEGFETWRGKGWYGVVEYQTKEGTS